MLPETAEAAEPPRRLMVVDDDELFLRTFAANLTAAGYAPACFNDPQEALAALLDGAPAAACILDIDMPGLDGLAFLHALGRHGLPIPVMFVTGHSEHVYEEAALRGGAADFVDKGRGPAIILQRIALMIRERPPAATAADMADLRAGALVLLRQARRAEWRGVEVPLSRTEFDVVLLLADRARAADGGGVVGYREIYDAIKGSGFVAGPGEEGYRGNVRATIKRLRRKFTDLNSDFAALETHPGFGYRWRRDG
jgi:two-component system response regulator ChvI